MSENVDDVKITRRKWNMASMTKKLIKLVDLREPTSFLHRVCKTNENVLINTPKCPNHEFLIHIEKLPGWKTLHAKTVAWSYDMD